MSRKLVFALVAAGLGAAFAAACGPSAQSIYEGNVRFEHCYRLDLDLNIAPTHRNACWKQWLSAYTYAQPRDRIEYARRRLRAFASGDLARPTLDLNVESNPEQRQFYVVVPGPTSVHAPPPPMATPVYTDAGAPPSPARVPPGASCAGACETSFRSCEAACGPDGGASEPACRSCEPDYKACMKRCYE